MSFSTFYQSASFLHLIFSPYLKVFKKNWKLHNIELNLIVSRITNNFGSILDIFYNS